MAEDNPRLDEALFERALADIASRVSPSGALPRSMAVAYSGGLDSSVLLHLARDFATTHGIVLHALHVHHGLSEHADAWLAHCEGEAQRLDIAFSKRRIAVDRGTGDGIEASARVGRYAALGEMCRVLDVALLLTAHHQDDQAETVLLQLLRGSGVAGLAGMDKCNHAPDLLGDDVLMMGRPMLDLPRAALQSIAASRGLSNIEDPSNRDQRHARNALRHQVMPVLEAAFPGFSRRFARTARHAQAAHHLLIDLAAQDMEKCAVAGGMSIDHLRLLHADRADNMLRYWFASHGMRMPSTAWLQQMRIQLLSAKEDAQVLVTHADCDIHRHRNVIVMTPRRPLPDPERDPLEDRQAFAWAGEGRLDFPVFGGSLHFDVTGTDGQGVAAEWLQGRTLAIQWRSGGWRLKPAYNRPTRSLKYHYQAADIPAWERSRLPLVTVGTELLFAAGLGMDCRHFGKPGEPRITLRWQAFDAGSAGVTRDDGADSTGA